MALGTFYSISTAGNNGVECRVYVSITDDSANNESDIDAELQVRKSNGFTSQGDTGGSFVINGTGINISGNKTLPGNGTWVTFGKTGVHTIKHGADGRAPSTRVQVEQVSMSGSQDYDTPIDGDLYFDSSNGFADYNRLPSAPGTPTDSAVTSTGMTWGWTAPNSVGDGILEYQLQYGTSSSFSGATTVSTGTSRSKALTGLSTGTKYYARVRARTGDGWGSYSGSGDSTTIPGTPTGLALSASTSTGMTADWADTKGATGYDIQYGTSSSFSGATTTTSTSSTKALTGLLTGTKYYVRVRAKGVGGTGAWSGSANRYTLPATVTGLVLSAPTATGMTAKWNAVTGTNEYEVNYSVNSDFSSSTTVQAGTALTKALTGLQSSKKYYVRVRAKNSVGSGAWSSSANKVTIPSAPTGVVISNPTTVSMRVNWTKGSGGTEITEYEVNYSTSSSFSGATTKTSPDTQEDLTGLIPGTTYYVRVRAKNASGTGAYSGTTSQTTLPALPPGLTVTPSPDGKAATLTFTPPGGVTGVDKYDWDRRVKGQTTETHGSEPDTSETVTGLTPGTTYEWRASAWIDSYESPLTGWITAVQPKPNTGAGDYFDGNTTDTGDVDYGWEGTANNSISKATAKGVAGWGFTTTGGVGGTLSQATGAAPVSYGSAGSKAALATFTKDATGAVEQGPVRNGANAAQVVPGGYYYGSIYVNPSRDQPMRGKIIFSDAAGVEITTRPYGDTVLCPANKWTRLTVGGLAGDTAEFATVRAQDDSAHPAFVLWKAGESMTLDAAMLTLGEVSPYFDGDTPDTDVWDFRWEGTAKASVSSAYPVDSEVNSPLEDPDCPRPPSAPRPPVIADDCITEVGTWQRYWSVIPPEYVTEWLTMVPTIALYIGDAPARQVRIRLYPNPANLPPETFVGEWSSEMIVSYLPAKSVLLLDGVDQRAWATVGVDAKRYAADHLLYGTGGTPATWPLLSCGDGYLASFDVPEDTPSGNLAVEIGLTQRRS